MRVYFVGLQIFLLATVFTYSGDEQQQAFPDLNFAQVEKVKAIETSEAVWRFDVSVRHNDEGWDHYADLWQVIDPGSGKILGQRVLAHPHETEQPFTRSQSGIAIPQNIKQVLVQAKCTIHGFGGREILLDLSETEGEGYQVQSRGQ